MSSNAESVVDATCAVCGIDRKDFYGRKRTRDIVVAREMVVYILRRRFGLSLRDIGKAINRDHATVLNLLYNFSYDLKTTEGMRKKYGAIVDRIEESVLYTELNRECEEILDGYETKESYSGV